MRELEERDEAKVGMKKKKGMATREAIARHIN